MCMITCVCVCLCVSMAARHSALRDKWSAQRREVEGESGSLNSAVESFWNTFNGMKGGIEGKVGTLERQYKTMEVGDITTAVEELTKSVHTLNETLSQHTHELPKYVCMCVCVVVCASRVQ